MISELGDGEVVMKIGAGAIVKLGEKSIELRLITQREGHGEIEALGGIEV